MKLHNLFFEWVPVQIRNDEYNLVKNLLIKPPSLSQQLSGHAADMRGGKVIFIHVCHMKSLLRSLHLI